MRRPAPSLCLSLVEREWPRRSPLACPPFGDVRRLWPHRNLAVLNELGVFGMFPLNCDLGHHGIVTLVTVGCISGTVRLKKVPGKRFCLVSALTSLSYFFA